MPEFIISNNGPCPDTRKITHMIAIHLTSLCGWLISNSIIYPKIPLIYPSDQFLLQSFPSQQMTQMSAQTKTPRAIFVSIQHQVLLTLTVKCMPSWSLSLPLHWCHLGLSHHHIPPEIQEALHGFLFISTLDSCNQFTSGWNVNQQESPMSTVHGLPITLSTEPRLHHGLQDPPWTDSASPYNRISYHHPFTIYHLQLLTFCSSNMPSTFLSRIFFFPASPHGTLSRALSSCDWLRSSHLSTNIRSLERLSLTSPILSLSHHPLYFLPENFLSLKSSSWRLPLWSSG